MKVEKLILGNFRSYKEEISIDLNDLNVLVGKNDSGKSTILEALDILFSEKQSIKIDKDDINKQALAEGNAEIKIGVVFGELPYPSLNEVNFLAFGESDEEYHNELYGFIEGEKLLEKYKNGKETMTYIRIRNNGDELEEQIILSEYIRHQIHHPENVRNARFNHEHSKNQ